MEEISQDYCVCAYNLSHTRTQQFARNALLYTAVPLGEITYTFANRNESVITVSYTHLTLPTKA